MDLRDVIIVFGVCLSACLIANGITMLLEGLVGGLLTWFRDKTNF